MSRYKIKMNNQNSQESFSWFRKTFFPVRMKELPKVLPFAIMFCGIIFSYTLARQAKEWLVAGVGGAELIPSAKIFVMVAGFIFGILHKKITSNNSHYMSFLKSFLPFIIFFAIFPYLCKYLHIVQPSPQTIKMLCTKLPVLRHFITILGNWLISLYYIMAEMLGTFMLGATFWQLANFYSSHDEAKRFYPFYSLIAQLGGYLAGTAFKYIGDIVKITTKEYGIFLITVVLLIASIIIIGSATYFFKVTLKMPEFAVEANEHKHKKKKHKVSIMEGLKNLAKNPTFILVCLLTIWYGICATSMETFWKGKIIELYGRGDKYMNFIGSYYQLTSIATFIVNILGGSLIRLLPWLIPAIITPIVVLFAAFFLFGINIGFISKFLHNLLHLEPLYLCVMVGAASLIFFKAAKYVLFDPTKEMFIRNQKEEDAIEIKALETSVARLGKGGSAVIQSVILSIPGMTLNGMSPILWIITTVMGVIWVFSILRINQDMVIVEEENKKK
jgi:AAA family ATP:ADP antiporter